LLNRSTAHLWAIVSNGLSLRILRDNQALSRQSFLEFDLEAMFDGEVYSDFVLLWLIAHATRFLPRNDGRAESCWLETWSKEAAEQGVAALTDLRGGVEKALQILGKASLATEEHRSPRSTPQRRAKALRLPRPASAHRLSAYLSLRRGRSRPRRHPSTAPQEKSDAARLARERYAAHYSTTRLRELASRIKGSRHGDLWQQFQLIVGALSGDDRFAALRAALALPLSAACSGIPPPPPSSTAQGSMSLNPQPQPSTPHHGTELSNVDFLEALRHLAFIRRTKSSDPWTTRTSALRNSAACTKASSP